MVDALFRPFKESGPPGRFDVNRLIKEALESADLPDSVRVDCDCASDLPKVESSPLLVDTFLELITNAEKAMAESRDKQLTIRTRMETDEAADWVVIEVGDTGCGIPEERMIHLWDMFQQSKNGLGYGLWWLRTFFVRQGGTIDCKSRPGEGSTFTIRLPAATDFEK